MLGWPCEQPYGAGAQMPYRQAGAGGVQLDGECGRKRGRMWGIWSI